MSNEYIYTKQDILKDFELKPGTFYNRIKELEIMDNPIYMNKIKENNREKTYFNQKAYDKIREYQDTIKSNEKVSNEDVTNVSHSDTIPLYLHNEIVSLLKQQLEEKDKQISNLHNIIGVKEQTTLIEKQKMLGTHEDNKKWWHKFRVFGNAKNTSPGSVS